MGTLSQGRLDYVSKTMKRSSPSSIPQSSSTSHAIHLDDEDDEDTLQLKLEAIEARLRLKRLQKQREAGAEQTVNIPVSPRKQRGLQKFESSEWRDRSPQLHVAVPRAPTLIQSDASGNPHHLTMRQERTCRTPLLPKSFNTKLSESRRSDQETCEKLQNARRIQSNSFNIHHSRPGSPPPTEASAGATSEEDKDVHSGIDLSRRFLAANTLQEAFDDSEPYRLSRLMKEVTSPSYGPPETDGNYVVFGILASKSSPLRHVTKPRVRSNEQSSEDGHPRFMVLHLTDLRWEIDLYLFGSGFDSFWKLSVGSVLAILNPGIMPPKRHMRDSGQFSLKLTSSDDAVLEIGTAAHLGFCTSIKRDGHGCNHWYDSRKADHCDFHTSIAVERSRSGRMETNTMNGAGLFGGRLSGKPGKWKGRESGRGSTSGSGGSASKRSSIQQGPGRYRDVEARADAYMVPPELLKGASTAQLLDAGDFVHHSSSNPEERRRKRLADKERDRKLATDLKAGVMKADEGSTHAECKAASLACSGQLDARSLGLIGSTNARLKPTRTGAALAVGWSSAFKRGLPTASQQGPSPKKARFDIAGKGLREPGKASFEDLRQRRNAPSDNEGDDLEVV